MSLKNICRLGCAAALAAGWAAAQAPAVTLVPRYTPNSHLFYSLVINSAIGSDATMVTTGEIDMHILAAAAPGSFDAEMRFLKYATTVKSASAADQTALAQQTATSDQAAQSMAAARFRVAAGKITVLSRPAGSQYDQPVEMLEELARDDSLPPGPASVGAQWSRHRTRQIPTMNFSVALKLDCSLTAVGPGPGAFSGQPAATIVVRSQGSTPLPPGSLPGSEALAAQGLVPEATVSFDTTATSIYRVADAILEQTSSETHNRMHLSLVGPSPDARTTDTEINSTATVQLERVVAGN